MTPFRSILAAAALPLALCACGAPAWQKVPHDRLFQRAPPPRLHEKPDELEGSNWWEAAYNSSFEQIGRLVSPGYHAQKSFGIQPALDVNDFGKVPDSSWFVNRMGRRRLTPLQVLKGPNRSDGPAPGKLVVLSAKTEGVTPGLLVEDGAGARWLAKFDPPGYPELTSAAEAISTRLLHAAGYHVPENHVVRFRLDRLELSPEATTKDRYARKVPLTKSALREMLEALDLEPDGRARAMFSKFLPGEPIGPFPLRGRRLDDPNDRIPHERRRSLRGLWVFYAWLNNTDAKLPNSLDVFLEAKTSNKGLGWVRHYLIDFGTTLGAGPTGPKPTAEGYEYIVDWERVLGRFVSAGIGDPYWARVPPPPLPSIGRFEAAIFDPARWRPMYPNAPFDHADELDTFWAASILAHFDLVTVAAAVAAGEYSHPAADDWVTRTLMQRRDKLLRHAFRELAPLDNPRAGRDATIELDDLEQVAGLARPGDFVYPWKLVWHRAGRDPGVAAGTSRAPRARLGPARAALEGRFGADALARAPFFTLELGRSRAGRPPPSTPRLDVHLRALSDGRFIPVGLEHRR